MFMTIAAGFGIAVLCYLVASSIYYAYFHPLAKVPGPKLYSFSNLPFLYHLARGDSHENLRILHQRYGPVVRITQTDVSFTSPAALKTIYGSKTGKEKTFGKDSLRFYNNLGPEEHPNIISASGEKHKRMRRSLSHAFSEKALINQEPVINRYINLFINKLTTKAQEGTVVNIVPWFDFAAFDLIGDLAFGEPFGCLEQGDYHPWVKTIFESAKILAVGQIICHLGLQSLIPILTPPALKRSDEQLRSFTKTLVVKRLDTGNTAREDFMSYVLRNNGSEDDMTLDETVENARVLIVAGSETTATLLSGTVYQILTHPEVYSKVVREIRSAFSSEDEITMVRVNQLQYMLAVLSETFRMYPPVPSQLPRMSPAGGEFVDGYWIPEGAYVSVSCWSAFRTEANFRDPDLFVPERWLGDARYTGDNKSVLQPFSIGPRNCIGMNLAYAEMRLILARLLWKFDLEMMPGGEGWSDQKVFFLWDKKKLDVKLTEVVRD